MGGLVNWFFQLKNTMIFCSSFQIKIEDVDPCKSQLSHLFQITQ